MLRNVNSFSISRLLAEKPDVVGIGVPGMPAGSPGMETPGVVPEPYEVFTFNEAGETAVYATYH
jgi:hypothetical protein